MPASDGTPAPFDALIVGGGIGGIAAGAALSRAGLSFSLAEAGPSLGGVWAKNTYPGARCDAICPLYSYSWAPHAWTATHAAQPAILEYLKQAADKAGVTPHVQLNTSVRGAEWDGDAGVWRVELEGPSGTSEAAARALVLATGLNSRPRRPEIPGIAEFAGRTVYTGEWDSSLDLANKRVGVVGTGASGTQLVSAASALPGADVTVFQRSFTAVLPLEFREYSAGEIEEMKRDPGKVAAFRAEKWGFYEMATGALFEGSPLVEQITGMCKAGLAAAVPDEALRAKLDFNHPPFAKRPILSDTYYADVQKPNVHLVTDPILRVVPQGVVVRSPDGSEETHALEVLAIAAGFSSADYDPGFPIVGPGGKSVHDLFAERGGAEALHGTCIEGMPNLFWMMGPNTYLPHTVFAFVELQADFVVAALGKIKEKGAKAVVPRTEAVRKYNAFLDEQLFAKKHIQAYEGVSNWFRSGKGRGKVTGAFPGTGAALFAFLEGGPKEEDYDFVN
ncbi:hypothetical protein DFJ74DRAFT_441777 [Hyaloraphidium curvatum]|nr:hypothetical protein DFJ74DRAFT_441777 [Hyaloraphidium curvatum]